MQPELMTLFITLYEIQPLRVKSFHEYDIFQMFVPPAFELLYITQFSQELIMVQIHGLRQKEKYTRVHLCLVQNGLV